MRTCKDCGASLSDTAGTDRSWCLRCWEAHKRSGTLPKRGRPPEPARVPDPPEPPWRTWLAVVVGVVAVVVIGRAILELRS